MKNDVKRQMAIENFKSACNGGRKGGKGCWGCSTKILPIDTNIEKAFYRLLKILYLTQLIEVFFHNGSNIYKWQFKLDFIESLAQFTTQRI